MCTHVFFLSFYTRLFAILSIQKKMEDLKKIQAEMEQMRKRLSTYEINYENKE